jgi:hypothetical protein
MAKIFFQTGMVLSPSAFPHRHAGVRQKRGPLEICHAFGLPVSSNPAA